MVDFDEMRDLVDNLNFYTELYDRGIPAISDQTWDDMYFRLKDLEEQSGVVLANSPTQHIDYKIVNKLAKVEHSHPMLSLDKTKSVDDVVSFMGNHDIIGMSKMDGLTCSLRYENGKLVSAETRGNGLVGEDITHNIFFVQSVPTIIPYQDTLVVDGEVICTYEDFEEFKDEYKNPRNFASGSIRLLDSRACANRYLTFVAWDAVEGLTEWTTLEQKLLALDNLGFDIVLFSVIKYNNITAPFIEGSINMAIDCIKNAAQEYSYPIDGIVFKYNDCAYYQSLGYTGHHFRGGLAYKFYDEEYETILRDIEWSMGKTGQLTPVAIFDPVDDGDSVVSRASLHNYNIMSQMLNIPFKGQKIWIAKMNMIIPQVTRAECPPQLSNDVEVFGPPLHCPICGESTYLNDGFVYCSNPHCEGKLVNKLDHFCGKKGLDIKGLSEATFEKLIDWGWVSSIEDVFKLDAKKYEWMEQPGFGEKSVLNILNAIEQAKNCEMWQFISGLSIPLIGSTYAKQIAKTVPDWHSFRELVQKGFNFAEWPDFGYEMNDALHKFDYTEADLLDLNYLMLHNSLWGNTEEKGSLAGKTFVITGKLNHFKNRGLLQNEIEARGGKVAGSVSSNTNYLVNNDSTSTSSKNVKAKSLNIPIITEDELIAML